MTGGGAQRRILTLMQEFVRRGHRIDLVTVMDGGVLSSEVPPEVHRFSLKNKFIRFLPGKNFRKLKLFCSRNALAEYLCQKKPEVLLSAASHTSLTAIAARRLSGTETPLVLRLSSHLTASHAGALNIFNRIRYRTACKWFSEVDAVIAVADGIAEDIAANTRLSPQRIKTIYNPTFTPDLIDRSLESFDHPWFDEKGPQVILGAGRLTSRKDFNNLIRAFAVVRKQREVRLIILGEGGKRGELLDLARDLGVSKDVDMPGFVQNPLAWMSRASVFVLSSECEGLPGVLIEAMAAGCPIVSTNCPSGPAEILENGKFGRLVPVKDPLALAQAIMATLDSPREEQLLRARASDFSVTNAADEYIKVLSQVVRRVS
ncbi:Glycosyltransferase involved in cell wall bisynthesis [Desulfopila aestuarii DSM 18488]|uniref:Glycosyltransferase involved in cell wall bisynthesis n=2 Tax=Desulfopila aestuarii TaxID=231440 RepID=A0A1M7YGT3_9BACT|nr:Glycosyltransferase involved in cell wall bisynthesis [Desulfopila aestuarii DSM 18488]